jgi:hypothetical protein
VEGSKILPTISAIYGVKLSISWHCVGHIFSEKNKWENKTCGSVKCLKGAKFRNLEDAWLDRGSECEKSSSK